LWLTVSFVGRVPQHLLLSIGNGVARGFFVFADWIIYFFTSGHSERSEESLHD